jgi:hypothetical protein
MRFTYLGHSTRAMVSMSEIERDEAHFFETPALPYVYVFWKQAEPATFEIAALQEVDPHLENLSISQVAILLNEGDYWRIGPLKSADQANAIESKLKKSGLRVEVKWQ